MNLEADVNALEHKWATWETACRGAVADEVISNELSAADPSHIMKTYPRNTYSEALAAFEDDRRRQYDVTRGADAAVLQAETNALQSALDEAIAGAEVVKSERDAFGTSTSNAIMVGVLEELVGQRLRGEWRELTIADLAHQYATWDQERGDRTPMKMLEDAMRAGTLTRLVRAADPERDAAAMLSLQRVVAERRKTRVPPALYALRDRLTGVRTLQRRLFITHLREGKGVARRPTSAMKLAIPAG